MWSSNDRSNLEARGEHREIQGRLNIDAAQTSTLPTRMPQAQSLAAADAVLIAAWQGGDELRSRDGDPHETAVAGEVEGRMREMLERLPHMQREVFLLRAQQGLEYEEIAAALGTSPGAARVQYHHAVRRLKESLQ